MMLDIIMKIVIQDIGSKSELSTRKYKPMMVLDDEVEADWASFTFSSLLENVQRCGTLKKKTQVLNEVHFGLLISYLYKRRCQK